MDGLASHQNGHRLISLYIYSSILKPILESQIVLHLILYLWFYAIEVLSDMCFCSRKFSSGFPYVRDLVLTRV